MLLKYPYSFTRQEPAKLSDAPEQYTNKGSRMDGAAEKNEHVAHGGRTFPTTKVSVYTEMLERGAKREQDHIETNKINQTRIIQNHIKQKVQKDTLQNLIYELKAREERFEQVSQIANQKGLGYPSV